MEEGLIGFLNGIVAGMNFLAAQSEEIIKYGTVGFGVSALLHVVSIIGIIVLFKKVSKTGCCKKGKK